MPRHNDVPKQLNVGLGEPSKASWHDPRLSFFAVIVIFALATMACALVSSGSRSGDRVVIRTLPTLTSTPLPILAPAPISTPAAVAIATLVPAAQAELDAPPAISPTNDNSALPLTENQTSSESLLTALVKLNVRVGPGLDYPVVGQLVQGESIQIIGKNPEGTWWQVVYPAGSGSLAWVSADGQYSTTSNVEAVQVAQLPRPPPPTATPTSDSAVQPDASTVAPGQTPLPSDTPAVASTQTPLPSDTPTAGLPQTAEPTGNPTNAPTATSIPGPPGWAFTGVRLYTDQYIGGLILYGSMINNTGSPQELISVTGTFFDAQGQVIADSDNTYAYWPGYVIPSGGSMPFELFVDDIDDAIKFDLSIDAEPSDETPRQDFQFADVNQWTEDDTYCVGGRVQHPGDDLDEYLIIAAVLYDNQNNIVNFSDYGEFGEEVGEDEPTFEICIDLPDQEIARHELQAWGR